MILLRWLARSRLRLLVCALVSLSALFLAVLPPFALIQRLVDRSKPTGWRPPHGAPLTLEDLKRPY